MCSTKTTPPDRSFEHKMSEGNNTQKKLNKACMKKRTEYKLALSVHAELGRLRSSKYFQSILISVWSYAVLLYDELFRYP